MARLTSLVYAAVFSLSIQNVCSGEHFRGGHGDLLRRGLDTTQWKGIYGDNVWKIECIFCDLDDDGIDEIIGSPIGNHDPFGDVWYCWRQNGRMAFSQCDISTNILFACHSDGYFRCRFSTGANAIVGLGMEAGYPDRRGVGFSTRTPDCLFKIDQCSLVSLMPIDEGLDNVFSLSMVHIERLYSEWYFGFGFLPPPKNDHSPYTTWLGYNRPKGDLRPGGGIKKPKGFVGFAAKLRSEVAARLGVGLKGIRVLAVFLDADNDGDTDAYVAFATDRTKGGKFRWTLYLDGGGVYSKAESSVLPVPSRRDLCVLPPSVIAPTNGFCRLVRFDVAPTFVILDGTGSPTKVRDAITDILSHRIEKLPCVEIGMEDEDIEYRRGKDLAQ